MNPKANYLRKGLVRTLHKMVPTEDGRGRTSVRDGFESADIEVSIDLEGLAERLGITAMKNKGAWSKYLGGLVVVRAVNKNRLETL